MCVDGVKGAPAAETILPVGTQAAMHTPLQCRTHRHPEGIAAQDATAEGAGSRRKAGRSDWGWSVGDALLPISVS